MNLAYVGKVPESRESDEWYTPSQYVEMARTVMGSIDLDPYSNTTANEVVKAKRYFSLENNAIGQPWSTPQRPVTVWANPPFGKNTLRPALNAFLSAWKAGEVSQAVLLVNNATETEWFHDLLDAASALCLVRRRISFWNSDGKAVSGNTRGQVFLYFGSRSEKFAEVFSEVGKVCPL